MLTNNTSEVSQEFTQLAERICVRNPIICDIGSRDAHEGFFLAIKLHARELHVFEPNRAAAEIRRRNLASHQEANRHIRIAFNELAVSDHNGTDTFDAVNVTQSVNKDIGLSSFYDVNPRYMRRRGNSYSGCAARSNNDAGPILC